MTIPSSNVSVTNHLVSQLLGNLVSSVNISMTKLGLTINSVAPHQMSEFYGLTCSLVRSPTTLTWATGVYGAKGITITANCAWRVTYAGSANFQVQSAGGNTTWSGSSPSGTFGGNGTISINRSAVAGVFTGTVTITFSNGAGGSTTLTVPLNSTG